MSKLSYEVKINIYNKKQGSSIAKLSKKYNIKDNHIKYLIRLIDAHGFDVLRTQKNKIYTNEEKERVINRVLLNNESKFSVAIDEGLSGDDYYLHGFQNTKKTRII